ncbi:MAG: DNA recombination protein RmuC, partial [Pseudomonadota bacterium]
MLGLLCGIVLGAALALLVTRKNAARRQAFAQEILRQTEQHRQAETEALLDGVKLAFNDISLEAFRRSSDELLKLSQTSLVAERHLQNQQLTTERSEFEARMTSITAQIERMQGLVRELERDRAGKFADLAARLDAASENAQTLNRATQRLADALANARVRGQWGERMAE